MSRLTRKESIAIATIHDALREFRMRGRSVNVNMMSDEISIIVYADIEYDAKSLQKTMCFFKDEDDMIHERHYPSNGRTNEFFAVELKKKMV